MKLNRRKFIASSAMLAGAAAVRPAEQTPAGQDVQYVMYVGTNDKDTNEPVMPPEEARAKAQEILLRHLG